MTNKKDNLYTKEDLLNLGIYELRELGRDVGVASPTTLKKQDLVDKILAIIYGEIPRQVIGKGRGRPARAKAKPRSIYLDLLDRTESLDNERIFIQSPDEAEFQYDYGSMLTTKVAESRLGYINDEEKHQEDGFLVEAVVCEEDGEFFARKLKFIKSPTDHIIPKAIVRDFELRDNDIIKYLPDDDENKVIQIFKINNAYAKRKVSIKNGLIDVNQKEIFIEQTKIEPGKSNIVYAPTSQDRLRMVDTVARVFEGMDYNTIKVCFDRNISKKAEDSGLAKIEIFASCVGDEYETIAMIEEGIDKAILFSTLGRDIVLIIDNLAWLMSVIKTYPATAYGNLIEKLGMLSKKSNITVVCVTGHLSNETLKELSNFYDNIN